MTNVLMRQTGSPVWHGFEGAPVYKGGFVRRRQEVIMTSAAARKADGFDAEVGARVRLVRRAKGVSQDVLGDAVGITFQQVQKYENGTNRISCSMLKRISERLDVPMAELLGEAEVRASGVDWTALHEPETVELARAFAALRSPGLKRRLQSLISELIAEAPPGEH